MYLCEVQAPLFSTYITQSFHHHQGQSVHYSHSCVKRLTPVPSTARHCCLQHSNIAMVILIFGPKGLYLLSPWFVE